MVESHCSPGSGFIKGSVWTVYGVREEGIRGDVLQCGIALINKAEQEKGETLQWRW